MRIQETGWRRNGHVRVERLLSPTEKWRIRAGFCASYFNEYIHIEESFNLMAKAGGLRQLFPQIRTCMAERKKAKYDMVAAEIIEATTLHDMHEFAAGRHESCRDSVRAELAKSGTAEFNRAELNKALYETWRWGINCWITEKALEIEHQKSR